MKFRDGLSFHLINDPNNLPLFLVVMASYDELRKEKAAKAILRGGNETFSRLIFPSILSILVAVQTLTTPRR